MASKRYAVVNQRRCVSCGACAGECPRGAIQIWRGCFARIDPALCIGCGRCQRTCPADCVSLRDRDAAERETAGRETAGREAAS